MSQDDIISTILTDLGWNENLAVPIANEENQKLLHLIDLKQKQTSTNKNDLDKLKEKIESMENHLKNCRQELQHSGKLKSAKESEMNSEDHMQKVDEREIGRLNQELKKLSIKLKDIYQNKNVYENTLFKKSTELEEIKAQMKWDQQALEAWLEESEKKGEDILSLQKYARQDESKIKELSLLLERHTATINDKKSLLEKEVIETKTTHVELEKTTDEYQKAYIERQNIIQQWEATIEQLKRRDHEIDNLSAKLALLRADASKLEEGLKSKNEFYENLITSNMDIEKNVELTERQTGKLRMEQRELEEQKFNFESELQALRRTCDRTAADLEQARTLITMLKKEKAEKEDKLEKIRMKGQELDEKLAAVQNEKTTAEERANMADKLLEEEEAKHVKFETELKQTRDLQFKKAQELYDAEIDQKNINAEISGNTTAVKNLNNKIYRLDHDLLKQQEILYKQDFEIQQLERRINHMEHGNHSNEEKEKLEEDIKQLTEQLEERTKVVTILITQTKRVQDEIRRCKYDTEKVEMENDTVTVKLEEVNLQNDRSQQELKRCRGEKEKVMVEDNIMKLEVKRLRDRLYCKAEEVYTLDMRKQQLNQAVRERFEEIKIHKEMLQSQIRSADDEKSKINADFKSRLSKIDKLEKRFEILTVTMAPPEGEEEQSQAYYVIKAAQDKEALQRQGDELDAKIRKTEKEIRALENTLELMNRCNQDYRKSLSKVTDVSEEMSVKKDLEAELRTVSDKYLFHRKQMTQLEEDYQLLKETYDNLIKDESLYQEQVDGLSEQLNQKEKEFTRHKEKLERAEKQITKLKADILESNLAPDFQIISEDIKIREQREFSRIAVNELQRHIQTHFPALLIETKQYLEAAGLPTTGPSPSPASSSRHTRSGPGGGRTTGTPASSIPQSPASSTASSLRSRHSTRGSGTPSNQKQSSSTPVAIIDMGAALGQTEITSPLSSAAGSRKSSIKGTPAPSSRASSQRSSTRSGGRMA